LAQGRHRLRPGFRVARPLRGRCHAGAVRRALVQEYHNICGGREIVLRVIQIPARRALITQGRCDCSSRNRSMAGASSSAVNGIAMSSAMSCCPVHAAASANPTRWPVTSRCSLSCSITTSRRTWSTVVNRSANSWAKSTTRSTRCRSASLDAPVPVPRKELAKCGRGSGVLLSHYRRRAAFEVDVVHADPHSIALRCAAALGQLIVNQTQQLPWDDAPRERVRGECTVAV